MATYNLEKWVKGAKILRHTTDACIGITATIVAVTAVTLLSAIKFIAVSETKTILFEGFYGVGARLIGYVIILIAYLTLLYVGRTAVSGKEKYLFGRPRTRKLAEKLTGDVEYLPSDYIEETAQITIKLEEAALVISGICLIAYLALAGIAPESTALLIAWMIRVSVISVIIAIASCIGLISYLKIGRIQLECQLKQEKTEERKPKAKRRRRISFKPRRCFDNEKRQSRVLLAIKAFLAKIRPKRYFDSRKRWRATH